MTSSVMDRAVAAGPCQPQWEFQTNGVLAAGALPGLVQLTVDPLGLDRIQVIKPALVGYFVGRRWGSADCYGLANPG